MLDLLFLLFVLYLVLNSWSSRSSSSAPYRSPRTWSTPSLDPRTSTTPTLPLDPSCNPYEGPELHSDMLWRIEGTSFFMFRYVPVSSGLPNTTRRWILDFKESKPEAIALAAHYAKKALTENEAFFRNRPDGHVYLVTIPSHSAYQPNTAGERLCALLDRQIPWVTHLPNALQRVTTVPKSSRSRGNRPGYEQHFQSIRYVGPAARPDDTIVMFDDVFTLGATSNACRDILKAAGWQRVLGLYLGKTIRYYYH